LQLCSLPDYGGPSLFPPLWAQGTLWWRDDFHEDLRGPGGSRLANMGEVVLNDLRQLTRLGVPVVPVMLDRPHSLQSQADEELPGWGTLYSGPGPLRLARAQGRLGP
jgi:hypothetical protein